MADAFTSDTYNALCRDAEDYLGRGLTEQARELLLKAVSLIGTRSKARSLLADACMSLGLWSEAREQLEQLITLELGSVQHHYRLGQVLEELEEKESALDNYRVVLELEGDHRGASVAVTRLNGRLQDATPGDSETGADDAPAAAPARPAGHSGSFQVFPDEAGAEDVFATSGEVESLLRDIGVVQPVDSETGVTELLSSVGINLDLPGKPEEAPPVEVRDVSALMGVPEAESEEGFSLQSVFGDSPEQDAGGEAEAAPSTEASPDEPAQPFDFTSVFKSVASPFPVPGVASADSEGAREGVQDPFLASIFAGSGETPAPQAATLEEPAEPGPAPEPEPAPEPRPIHEAGPAPEPRPIPEPEPAPEPVKASGPGEPVQVLESVFASPEETPAPEEDAPEEPAEPGPAPEPGPVPEPGPAPEPEPSPEPPIQAIAPERPSPEAPAPSIEIVYGPASDAAPEAPPAVQAAEEPAGQPEASGPALFDVHPTSSDELIIVDLLEGRVEARLAFIAAMDGSVSVTEEGSRRILSGMGTIVLGQSPRVPVVLMLDDGNLVRRDRIVLCDAEAEFSEAVDSILPSMFRVEGRGGAAVAFTGGRCSTLSLAGGRDLLVRAAGIVQISKGVEAAQDPGNPDFVRLRGDGSVLVSF